MGDDAIFLIRGDDLVVLQASPYDSEHLLQDALARFPQVLAGGTTRGDRNRRLLLVRREMGVPASEGASATWSVDHLFIDEEAVPVIVEVKRASDTRIRREVVGQMLDYAANGVRYWPVSELRAAVSEKAESQGHSVSDHLSDVIGVDDEEAFWSDVEANLAAGRIRMVFVADRLPEELVRVIEFLNEQMTPGEVLGVEVPQYVGGGEQVLVPRTVGRTTEAIIKKPATTRGTWREDEVIAEVAAHFSEDAVTAVGALLADASSNGARTHFGQSTLAGVSAWYCLQDQATRPLWYLQVRTPPAARLRLSFAFYWSELATHLDSETYGRFLERLCGLDCFAEWLGPLVSAGERPTNGAIDLVDVVAQTGALELLLQAIRVTTVRP